MAALDSHRVHQPLAWNPNREHGVAVGAADVAQVLGLRNHIHAWWPAGVEVAAARRAVVYMFELRRKVWGESKQRVSGCLLDVW